MKRALVILFALAFIVTSDLIAKPGPEISFNYFYSSLRPYGEWIEIDADLYAWRPMHVSSNWKPYREGRWSWTRHGWYWDSYEPFGWAVYHYGRWHYDDYYGWIWIPDYEWGPAWVEWRYSDNYIGWAPLPPYASFHSDFGIRFSIGWSASYNWWNFVPYRRFCDYRVNHYIIDYRRTSRIFSTTKYRNNYYYDRDRIVNGGIDRRFVEDRAGYRIAEREIRSVESRDDYNRLRKRDSNRIYNYRPSENETGRIRNDEKFEIRRSERSIAIEKDKIATPRASERNIERSRESDTGRNRNTEEGRIERNRSETERDRTNNREREELQKRETEERKSVREREESEKREAQRIEMKRQRDESEKRAILRRESDREKSSTYERQKSERIVEPERRRESNSESRNESRSPERSRSYERQQTERKVEPERRRESNNERPETRRSESSSESRSPERRR
ncbi:MAG: hypothetical protein FD143_2787 [Ignavibacteria bacterium]|nr:MAG: hypothetical protein FD143_2787 [Ignavibacteria bacterium]KAF0158307.1 MAG: hypothetical protein FD188_2565 [Ignavibacteria bacterium]